MFNKAQVLLIITMVHLFQNRFKSEVVDNDVYFLAVLRYIHQNLVKAGIVKSVGDYKWSSYNYYFNYNNELVDTAFVLSFFKDIRQFETFLRRKTMEISVSIIASVPFIVSFLILLFNYAVKESWVIITLLLTTSYIFSKFYSGQLTS